MKFEYDGKAEEKDCVAIIHAGGALIMQLNDGCIALGEDGTNKWHEDKEIEFWDDMAAHKFYPGDKITITF